MSTLKLEPLNISVLAQDYEEDFLVEGVLAELQPNTQIEYIDPRGLAHFNCQMHFSRIFGQLPPEQKFILCWTRMLDYAGVPFRLNGSNPQIYHEYLYQVYTGAINGDNKASVQFSSYRDRELVWDRRHEVHKKVLDHLTPHLHDVLNDVMGTASEHLRYYPNAGFARFLRPILASFNNPILPSDGWARFR